MTLPFFSRSALSQSIWSVSEYQVKPTIGTPSLRTRSTLAHSFHSQSTASVPSGPCVEVGLGVHHRQAGSGRDIGG